MAKQVRILNANEKLELAIKLNRQFDAMCAELGALPDPQVMVIALYSRNEPHERRLLLLKELLHV